MCSQKIVIISLWLCASGAQINRDAIQFLRVFGRRLVETTGDV